MLEQQMLIQFSTQHNNNKFYHAELVDDWNIRVRYGRVGTPGKMHFYYGGKAKYDKLLAEKRKKGYKDAKIEELPHDGNDTIVVRNEIDVALDEITYKDKEAKTLVQVISQKNVHKITGTTSITFDSKDGLFKTPLGVVTRVGVEEAMELLEQIEQKLTLMQTPQPTTRTRKRKANGTMVDTPSSLKSKLLDLNEQYFVIIPNKVKNATHTDNLLFSQEAVDTQRATCKALLETLDLINGLKEAVSKKKSKDAPPSFRVEIETIKDKKTLDTVCNMYENSKNEKHGYHCNNSRVIKVYRIRLESQIAPFEEAEKKLGGVQQLFHGTRTENILSIMSRGLLLPKESPGGWKGAMFGHGIYFANQSTKSLNYCDGGYWRGPNGANDSVYMFLASVAMGKHYTPKGPTRDPPSKGYDSYWAKAGKSGVLNDEIIVFQTGQVRFDYLLEIERL